MAETSREPPYMAWLAWVLDNLVLVSLLSVLAIALGFVGVWLISRVMQGLRARKLAGVEADAKHGAKHLGDSPVELIAVIAAAVVAEALAIDGVRFAFTEAFTSDSLAAHGGFVVFTLALIVEGRRAARVYRLTGRVGADFYVAAGFAVTAGLMAAWAEATLHAAAGRFVIAIIAGLLVARGVVLRRAAVEAASDEDRPRKLRRLAWRLTPERVLAALRLIDPDERDVGDVDRARRAAALAKVSDKLETAKERKDSKWNSQRIRRLKARQRRLVRKADAATWKLAQVQLAAMHKADHALSRKGVEHIDPWNPDEELQALLEGHLPAAPTSPAGPFDVHRGLHPKPNLKPRWASRESHREANTKPKTASAEARSEAKTGLMVKPESASQSAPREADMKLPTNTTVRRWYQQRLRRGSEPPLREVAKRLGVRQKDAQPFVEKWSADKS